MHGADTDKRALSATESASYSLERVARRTALFLRLAISCSTVA